VAVSSLMVLVAAVRAATAGGLDGLADAVVARATPALADARGLDVLVWASAGTGVSPAAATALAELVAARLGRTGLRVVDVARSGAVDEERARREGYERVVALALETEAGRARVRGAVIAVEGGPWAARTETRSQLFAAVPIDEELRVALAMNAPAPPQNPTAPPEPGPVRARTIALGDVDGIALSVRAGRVAVATAREVIVVEIRGERAHERARMALDGEWAPSPPRVAVGAVRLQQLSEGDAIVVDARSSLFVDGLRWRIEGTATPKAPSGRARGFPLDGLDGSCELAAGGDWFTPASCGRAGGTLPDRFWVAAELVRRDGTRAEAAIVPASVEGREPTVRPPRLWVRDRGAAAVEIAGVGAQLAIGTLPRGEVVVTSDAVDGASAADAITLRALAPGLPVVHRLERSGAVRAIAVGDADGDGRAEVVALVREGAGRRSELVLLQ
jgi:hypothetical protein